MNKSKSAPTVDKFPRVHNLSLKIACIKREMLDDIRFEILLEMQQHVDFRIHNVYFCFFRKIDSVHNKVTAKLNSIVAKELVTNDVFVCADDFSNIVAEFNKNYDELYLSYNEHMDIAVRENKDGITNYLRSCLDDQDSDVDLAKMKKLISKYQLEYVDKLDTDIFNQMKSKRSDVKNMILDYKYVIMLQLEKYIAKTLRLFIQQPYSVFTSSTAKLKTELATQISRYSHCFCYDADEMIKYVTKIISDNMKEHDETKIMIDAISNELDATVQ